MSEDDFRADALPDAVTDPDTRTASEEGQAAHRQRRLDHTAAVEAHRPTPEADPGRQGAFEQKPDVQQQQVELWAHKWLEHAEQFAASGVRDVDAAWRRWVRENELPEVWADTLVLPRAKELADRRMQEVVRPAGERVAYLSVDQDAPDAGKVPGLFDSTEEVQLEGSPSPVPATGATGRHDERGPSGNDFQVGRVEPAPPQPRVIPSSAVQQAGEAALLTALHQIQEGMQVEAALIERLERLAGL